ncbi:hypothetical protein HELRODRAFT_173167 [Helobdella robusta]|uniref:Endonuclease/exonuclease/phosphatase domain-containing protein n=1 Tax=Helobdella robusta TaxID=6412 RepID=T1F6H8_HELRO|nr:hypothetical protein HELRODRAFT_173167 [Helobdella robusta]ESO04090.1 hypothetical protein HELRODRAFT_173167 [Helobdella robusta]
MALSIRQKRVRRISGDPVHGVVVQGPVDGLATGTPLYNVAVQGTIDERTTCRPMVWRFGTWNVGTLTGRSLEVVEELQRRMVDVAALQEIRWKGEGTRFVGAKGGRYKLWWKGDDGTGGVGVMVREELVEKVLEVRRRSNGVIVVVMVFGKVIVRVISGYASQQSRKEEEKDRFYDDVSDEIGQAGLDEFVVLLGDLNGHVGADADGYEGVHGGWGYGIRNEEGRRVLDLADAHNMVVGNTWFTREPARLITYWSGEHRSMIDYILVRAKHRKYVKNVKAIPVGVQQGEFMAFSKFQNPYTVFVLRPVAKASMDSVEPICFISNMAVEVATYQSCQPFAFPACRSPSSNLPLKYFTIVHTLLKIVVRERGIQNHTKIRHSGLEVGKFSLCKDVMIHITKRSAIFNVCNFVITNGITNQTSENTFNSAVYIEWPFQISD